MKISAKFFTLLLCLVLSTPDAVPQEKHKTEANANIVEYASRDGLPTTSFSNFAQTKDGYIWISGIEGTYRFNGYEFEEIGTDIGLPKMQNLYYDSVNDIVYFVSPEKLIIKRENDFEVYTEKEGYRINGLAGQMISFIDTDSKGRIWIGSYTPWADKKNNGGLTRFMNGEFFVYDSTNFPLDNAESFIETPYGDLVFSSYGRNTQTREGSYSAILKGNKFQIIDESMGIDLQGMVIFEETRSQAIDKDGNTWLAFAGFNNSSNEISKAGILMYDGNKFHQYGELDSLLEETQFPLQIFYSKVRDKLFMTTFQLELEICNGNNQGIYEFKKGKWVLSDILKEIYPIKNLKSGKKIHDLQYSLAFFMPANRYFPELLKISGSSGENQAATYPNQLFSFNNGRWEKLDAFEGDFPHELNNGMLFSSSRGLRFYYPNYSRMLTVEDGLSINQSFVLSPYADKNGLVWISYSYTDLPAYASTYNVGINVWDGEKLRKITEKDGLASNTTFKIFQDSKERIWIPTSKGLTLAREIKNSMNEHILKLNNIQSGAGKPYNTSNILETKNGIIYTWQNYVRPASHNIISADYFLGKLDNDRIVKIEFPFSDEERGTKYQLYDLREDNEGRIWLLGTFSDNLNEINSANTKIKIYDGTAWEDPPDNWNIPQEKLHYVGNLESGMYFLTVDNFLVFNGEKFISLGDSTNNEADFSILKGASVTGTMTDIQVGNKLYIRLRNKGLVIFDGSKLEYYTKNEGLPSANISNPVVDEFRHSVFFASPVGGVKIQDNSFQVYNNDENTIIGGPNVVIQDGFGNMLEFYNQAGLYINKIEEKTYPIVISSISAEDSIHYYEFPQELAYSQNSFIFNYAALNFKDPKQTTYEHFLEGYDKDWSRPSSITFAEYQNLPFGEYTFRVRGITANGIKTDEASYSFIINPPFWRTWWAYVIYGVIFILGVILVDRLQRRRLLEKERKLISERELAHAKEIEKAYTELKATQNQLIHAEKMASLGELMAGIAHEIQNPLNFVNNFSEVSNELITEMNDELNNGKTESAKDISNEVKRNLDKIHYHGRRADAIVKGMLAHSNKNNGHKEPTDINILADEYLRIGFHGMKARNKPFNVSMIKDFDSALPKINIVPQDIGRVLLNLINNAFYAVSTSSKADSSFKPEVVVKTWSDNGNVMISVADNGPGIPADIKDKIFQPFFTTKASGQGTGLGLSLSYDIITKGHGGKISVNTSVGEGTVFIIQLPLK